MVHFHGLARGIGCKRNKEKGEKLKVIFSEVFSLEKKGRDDVSPN